LRGESTTVDKDKARPERVVRFYVAGELVSPEGFWEAVRAAGGTATVVAHDPKPAERGYRLTPAGEAALRREDGR
jgi:hypothetical protein